MLIACERGLPGVMAQVTDRQAVGAFLLGIAVGELLHVSGLRAENGLVM